MAKRTDFKTQELIDALERFNGVVKYAARYLEIPETSLYRWVDQDPELLAKKEAMRANRLLQKERDLNRVKNKTFREHARIENATEEYCKAILAELKNLPKIKMKPIAPPVETKATGVLHLTDTHFNELVDGVANNRYDWKVASRRLRLYVQTAIRYLKVHRIKNVLLFLGGDLMNSDRRLDELTSNSTNRAKATVLILHLLRQAIKELNENGYHITVASVVGNESRIGQVRGWESFQATENFDYMVHQLLAIMFEGCESIVFSPMEDECNAKIVSVAGHKWILTHGDTALAKGSQREFQALIGKYAAAKGDVIRFVLCGHIHMAFVSDLFSRGGSMVGDNAYNWNALNLTGRASQNMHIAWEDGRINSIKIDLQEASHIQGYDIEEKLMTYNAKSAKKAQKQTVILEVRV